MVATDECIPLGTHLRQLDLYALLEVAPDADTEAIRRAYRKAAFGCHPDHHPDDQAVATRFVPLTQARAILLSDKGRRTYDEMCERHGMGRVAVSVEGKGPLTQRRGVRAAWAKAPLSELQLAERAKKSRSSAELSALWRISTIVVRLAILRNPYCPESVYGDPHIEQHRMLGLEAAKRVQYSPDVLERLAHSFERVVALAVAKHPNTPTAGLACIAVRHRDFEMLKARAGHAYAGPAVLRDLGRAVHGVSSRSLGIALLANPACPSDVEQRVRKRLGVLVA